MDARAFSSCTFSSMHPSRSPVALPCCPTVTLHHFRARQPLAALSFAALQMAGALMWIGLAIAFGLIEAIVFVGERAARFTRSVQATDTGKLVKRPNS